MDIQDKIDLENIRYDSQISAFRSLPKLKKRDKISRLRFWLSSHDDKKTINECIENEKRHLERDKLISRHNKLISKLKYEKALNDIRNKKAIPIKAEKQQEPIFYYDSTKRNNWLLHPIVSLKKKYWRAFEKEFLLLINMQLDNGKHISFLRKAEDGKFMLFGRSYIIDKNLCYHSLSAGLNCLDYHQSFSIPIKRNWDADGLKTAIEISGVIDAPAATNPSNITRFLNSNIIEQIFNGAALGKLLTLILILVIGCLILIIGTNIFFYMKIEGVMKILSTLVK